MELQAVENYEIFIFKKKILVSARKIEQRTIRLVGNHFRRYCSSPKDKMVGT